MHGLFELNSTAIDVQDHPFSGFRTNDPEDAVTTMNEAQERVSEVVPVQREPNNAERIQEVSPFVPDLSRPVSLLIMVAGTGATPALAIVRSRSQLRSGAHVMIDHTAHTADQLTGKTEFETAAANYDGINYRCRCAADGERVTFDEIRRLNQQYPDAHWMVCGPDRYAKSVTTALDELKIDPGRILIERCPTQTVNIDHKPTDHARRFMIGISTSLSVTLFVLLDLVPEAVSHWQSTPVGHWLSGSALLMFLGFQWWLPAKQWSGSGHVSPRLREWHRDLGAWSPLLLLLHGSSGGTGTVQILWLLFILNTIVGICDRFTLPSRERQMRYFRWWLFPHIIFSSLITVLSVHHVWNILSHGGP
ncbi:MAG: hypothetical protein MK110_03210 [Fuerstiella sp.]|nr:hypothetical protein [Fuerstiella sp.]